MPQVEDDAGSALDASAAVGPPPPAAAAFAVALKLPAQFGGGWVQGKYVALKGQGAASAALCPLLLQRYALSDVERAEKLLSLTGLGGGTALELMLSLLGPYDGGFLFAHLFLRQLAAVRASLVNSLAARDYLALAEEADQILLATHTFDMHALATNPPATSPPAYPGASDPSPTAGIATRWHREKSLCFYHQCFGARAHRCLPRFSFSAQGNGPARLP